MRGRVLGIVGVLVASSVMGITGASTGSAAPTTARGPSRPSTEVLAAALQQIEHAPSRAPRRAYAKRMSCYRYKAADGTGDTTGGIDATGLTLSYDCARGEWAATFTTANPFSDQTLSAGLLFADVDGNAQNNCGGSDRVVISGWSSSGQRIVGGVFLLDGFCDVTYLAPASVDRAGGSRSVSVYYADADINNASVASYFGSISGEFGALDPSDFDYVPETTDIITRRSASSAFIAGKAPTLNGSYRDIIPGDFNSNGQADYLLYAPGTAPDFYMEPDANGVFVSTPTTINGTYTRIVPGDYNGDGLTDVFMYLAGTGTDYLRLARAGGGYDVYPQTINGTYTALLAGDYNRDGIDDLIWYAAGAGKDYVWFGTIFGFVKQQLTLTGSWLLATVGDYNYDGASDVAFVSASGSGSLVLAGQASGNFVSRPFSAGGAYAKAYGGDFNGDGSSDLLLYNPDTGADKMLNGTRRAGTFAAGAGIILNEHFLVAVGDFNAKGGDDLLMYGPGGVPERWWQGRTIPPILTPNFPDATIGVPYQGSILVTSAKSPLFVTASRMPRGLTLDPNTGVIAGTPTAIEPWSTIKLIVRTASGASTSTIVDVRVRPQTASQGVPLATYSTLSDGIVVDEELQRLYLVNGGGFAVLDLDGNQISNVSGLQQSNGLAYDESTLYVTDGSAQRIALFDRRTMSATGTISTGSYFPNDVVVEGGRIWFSYFTASQGPGGIGMYDPVTGSVSSVVTGTNPYLLLRSSPFAPGQLLLIDQGSFFSWLTQYSISAGTLTKLSSSPAPLPGNICRDASLVANSLDVVTACNRGVIDEFDASTLADLGHPYLMGQWGFQPRAIDATAANGGWIVAGGVPNPGAAFAAYRPGDDTAKLVWTFADMYEEVTTLAIAPDGKSVFVVGLSGLSGWNLTVVPLP